MKKLAKGILYTGGLIGSFAAGAWFIAAMLVLGHETAGDADLADLVVDNDSMKVTFIGLHKRRFEPGCYPGILEVKEKNH